MPRRTGERLAPSKGVENEYYNSFRPYADAMCRTVRTAVRRPTLRHVRQRVVSHGTTPRAIGGADMGNIGLW